MGGIKNSHQTQQKIAGFSAKTGVCGGSGFWCVKNDFYRDVGFLDLNLLTGLNKKHDQMYWNKLYQSTNGKDYILGLDHKLCIHTGSMAGSVCNTATRNKNAKNLNELLKFEESEKAIDEINFDSFYELIKNSKEMTNDW